MRVSAPYDSILKSKNREKSDTIIYLDLHVKE